MSSTSIEKLLEIMRQLRDPEQGCEWDKKQTFKSLIPYLKEELGDLLLQVVFHSQIAKEKKLFSFDEVVEELSKKLVRRHPYVFDSKKKHTAEEQTQMWKKIKSEEKK